MSRSYRAPGAGVKRSQHRPQASKLTPIQLAAASLLEKPVAALIPRQAQSQGNRTSIIFQHAPPTVQQPSVASVAAKPTATVGISVPVVQPSVPVVTGTTTSAPQPVAPQSSQPQPQRVHDVASLAGLLAKSAVAGNFGSTRNLNAAGQPSATPSSVAAQIAASAVQQGPPPPSASPVAVNGPSSTSVQPASVSQSSGTYAAMPSATTSSEPTRPPPAPRTLANITADLTFLTGPRRPVVPTAKAAPVHQMNAMEGLYPPAQNQPHRHSPAPSNASVVMAASKNSASSSDRPSVSSSVPSSAASSNFTVPRKAVVRTRQMASQGFIFESQADGDAPGNRARAGRAVQTAQQRAAAQMAAARGFAATRAAIQDQMHLANAARRAEHRTGTATPQTQSTVDGEHLVRILGEPPSPAVLGKDPALDVASTSLGIEDAVVLEEDELIDDDQANAERQKKKSDGTQESKSNETGFKPAPMSRQGSMVKGMVNPFQRGGTIKNLNKGLEKDFSSSVDGDGSGAAPPAFDRPLSNKHTRSTRHLTLDDVRRGTAHVVPGGAVVAGAITPGSPPELSKQLSQHALSQQHAVEGSTTVSIMESQQHAKGSLGEIHLGAGSSSTLADDGDAGLEMITFHQAPHTQDGDDGLGTKEAEADEFDKEQVQLQYNAHSGFTATGEAAPSSIFRVPKILKQFWLLLQLLHQCTHGTMPEAGVWMGSHPLTGFLDAVFRGWGQVVFQNNPLTGIAILIALFIANQWIAFMGLVASLVATFMAYILGLNPGAYASGLFGYNAALVGLAFATFDVASGVGEWNPAILGPLVLLSCFSNILLVAMSNVLVAHFHIAPLTLPFNLAAIIYLTAAVNTAYFTVPFYSGSSGEKHVHLRAEERMDIDWEKIFKAIPIGVSQVFLCDYYVSGIIMILGIGICSPIGAFFAVVGSFIGELTALGLGIDPGKIYAGLYGYNSVLAAMALGGFFYLPNAASTGFALFAAAICSLVQTTLAVWFTAWGGFPTLTFPFCLVTLCFLLLQNSTPRVKLIPIPLAILTYPEEHRKRYAIHEEFLKELKHTSELISILETEELHRLEDAKIAADILSTKDKEVTPAEAAIEIAKQIALKRSTRHHVELRQQSAAAKKAAEKSKAALTAEAHKQLSPEEIEERTEHLDYLLDSFFDMLDPDGETDAVSVLQIKQSLNSVLGTIHSASVLSLEELAKMLFSFPEDEKSQMDGENEQNDEFGMNGEVLDDESSGVPSDLTMFLSLDPDDIFVEYDQLFNFFLYKKERIDWKAQFLREEDMDGTQAAIAVAESSDSSDDE